jgi:hypothetical protein
MGQKALGFEEDLMRILSGKPMDLVFDGWAVTGSDACDLAGEQRRAIEGRRDYFVRRPVGVGDPTRNLARMLVRRSHE